MFWTGIWAAHFKHVYHLPFKRFVLENKFLRQNFRKKERLIGRKAIMFWFINVCEQMCQIAGSIT